MHTQAYHRIVFLLLFLGIGFSTFGLPFPKSKHNTLKGKVVIILSPTCPICKYYGMDLSYYDSLLKANNMTLEIVFPKVHAKDVNKYVLDYGLDNMNIFIDKKKRYIKKYTFRITPECVFLNDKEKVLYRGKIDNRYEKVGEKRSFADNFYLKDAIQNFILGKDILIKETNPVGCIIQ